MEVVYLGPIPPSKRRSVSPLQSRITKPKRVPKRKESSQALICPSLSSPHSYPPSPSTLTFPPTFSSGESEEEEVEIDREAAILSQMLLRCLDAEDGHSGVPLYRQTSIPTSLLSCPSYLSGKDSDCRSAGPSYSNRSKADYAEGKAEPVVEELGREADC